jgi:hypothetical protein
MAAHEHIHPGSLQEALQGGAAEEETGPAGGRRLKSVNRIARIAPCERLDIALVVGVDWTGDEGDVVRVAKVGTDAAVDAEDASADAAPNGMYAKALMTCR